MRLMDLRAEFHTDEGCFITELSNIPEDADASIARARVLPGVTTRWHRLKGTAERYVILSGTGRVEVGELPAQEVAPNDVVLIPAGVPAADYLHERGGSGVSGDLHAALSAGGVRGYRSGAALRALLFGHE